MATLQTIRDKAGILIALVIGLALLAFVLGDFFGQGSGPSFNRKKINEIAEIGGKSIPYQEYDQKIQNLTEIYKITQPTIDEGMTESIREQTWLQLIREYVLDKELDRVGIRVSADELFDLIQGAEPHPYIRELFTNPETGLLNRSGLLQFLKTMGSDPGQQAYWLFLENEILQDREFNKYNNLIRQGLYISNLEAELEHLATNKKVDFNYVVRRFTSIADSLIQVTEKDIESYYRTHKNNYKQTASRNIEYVVFEVNPSAQDIKSAEDWINNIKKDFVEAEDVRQFINLSADTPYDNKNLNIEDIPAIIRDFIENAAIGNVFGPYFENETYKLAKLAEINFLPDSVHAQHILITPNANRSYDQARSEADSLKNLIDSGIDFSLLATLNSDDRGSAQLGGDLGWFREDVMVQPFNDACFQGKTGDVTIVETQFGFHIIEILDQGELVKKYKVGIIDRKVEPSSSTYQAIYSEASMFAGTNATYEKFEQSIAGQQLEKRIANDIKIDDKIIPGLESPRLLIRSIYETDEGDIILDYNDQAVFELGNKFLVAYLTEVKEEGSAPLEHVRSEVELNVQKEKKAEKIAGELKAEISENVSMQALAEKFDLNIEEATNISYNSFSVPGAGIEPAVISTAVNMEQDVLSAPIKGANGVYVIVVTAIVEPDEIDLIAEKARLTSTFRARANYEAFEALKKSARIVDSRSKFY